MRSSEVGWQAGEHHERIGDRARAFASSDRGFGFAAAAVLVGLWAIAYMRTGHSLWWMIAAAGIVVVCALAAPSVLSPLNRAWNALGYGLSRITSPVVLAAIYCLAIVPAGLIMRLYRRDPLNRRVEPDAATYWSRRPVERNDMKNQF